MKIPNLPFNPKPSTILHLDLNSAFASIEQLADPHLRGRPIAVAAYVSPRGCIVAPSIEAKRAGVKVGMPVQQGKQLCRDLIVLPPDPPKYRTVHLQFKKLCAEYTDRVLPLSIDEFVLNLEGTPAMHEGLHTVAHALKRRIRNEIGESLTVSMGIAPNHFLAKTAAGLHKPDGLDEINVTNFAEIYARLQLMDLCGIKKNNCVRLNQHGIYSVTAFYRASTQTLQAAFESINGYYWYLRLHGWEPDDVEIARHSFGNSYALPQAWRTPDELAPILLKLVEKTGFRMRRAGYRCRGVHVALVYRDGAHWHQGLTLAEPLFDSRDIYKLAFKIMCASPYKGAVASLAESVFNLERAEARQASFMDDFAKKEKLVQALDDINERWGDFVITPARMIAAKELMPDRIGFGSARDLQEQITR